MKLPAIRNIPGRWPDNTYAFQGRNPFTSKPELSPFAAELQEYLATSDLKMIQPGRVDIENEVATVTAWIGPEEKHIFIRRGVDGKLEHVTATSITR